MHPRLIWGSKENDEAAAKIKAAEPAKPSRVVYSIYCVDPEHWFRLGLAFLVAGLALTMWSWYQSSYGTPPSDPQAMLNVVIMITLYLTGVGIVAQALYRFSRRE
jgi:hypothetical protein